MRIAISGTACQGKSTLISDFLEKWPNYTTSKKTYRDIISEQGLEHSSLTNKDSANLLMTALAGASTGNSSTATDNLHVFRSAAANRFVLDDLNKLFTKIKRINSSFVGGTPSGARRGLTDLIVSPEIVEQIRGMAYNPIGTKGPDLTSDPAAGDGSGLTAPDSVRNQVFGQAGLPEFFGVSIMEILELGTCTIRLRYYYYEWFNHCYNHMSLGSRPRTR